MKLKKERECGCWSQILALESGFSTSDGVTSRNLIDLSVRPFLHL